MGLDAARETVAISRAMATVAEKQDLPRRIQNGDNRHAGFLLLFPAGLRPGGEDIARLFDAPESSISARVSHRPDPAAGWLEVLSSGLTFDLKGLSPAEPVPMDAPPYAYGFERGRPGGALEAIALVPSGHVAAGAVLEPVLRTMVGLAANLALNLPVVAVAWQPAQTIMDPAYFSRIAFNWLSGGAFPALGLTALIPAADGSIASLGLSHFIGQEMQLEAEAGEPQAESVKLAVRLVDYLARHGPLTAPVTIEQVGGTLLAEPSRAGKRVWVWRQPA